MRFVHLGAIGALACLFLAAPASSAVLFSNLGPGGGFSGTTLIVDQGQWLASDFTVTDSGDVSSIRVPLLGRGTPNAPLTFSLRAPGSSPVGAVLDTWTLTLADLPDPQALVTLVPHTTVSLVSGTTYWLRAESNNTTGTYGWSRNSIGDVGQALSSNAGATFTISNGTALALEVNGAPPTAVPEPASIGMVLFGLGLIGWRARTRLQNT